MVEVNNYAIENLPKSLNDDEFYCFNKIRNNISIGKIIGKSALTNNLILSIRGINVTTNSDWFKKDKFTIYNPITLTIFKKYDDLLDEYNSQLKAEQMAKEEKKKNTIVKYVVNKETFFCKKITSKSIPYNFKSFDKKEEAEEYSRKGLIKLKKTVDKYIPIAENIIKIIKDKKAKIYSYNATYQHGLSVFDLKARANNVSIGDELFKINKVSILENLGFLGEFDKNYYTKVVEIIEGANNPIAKLSDNTLLTEIEHLSYPFLIKGKDLKLAISLLKFSNSSRIESNVSLWLQSLKRIKNFIDSYEPFKKGFVDMYFSNKNAKNGIDEINKLIKNFEYI